MLRYIGVPAYSQVVFVAHYCARHPDDVYHRAEKTFQQACSSLSQGAELRRRYGRLGGTSLLSPG